MAEAAMPLSFDKTVCTEKYNLKFSKGEGLKVSIEKNVQVLKKQLIIAVLMVLAALFALVSSTFAWFVSSSKVDANSMSVVATANVGYLEIQNIGADFTGGSTAVEATNAGDTVNLDLKPVTPFTVSDLSKDGTENIDQLAVSSVEDADGYKDGFIWTWTTAQLGTASDKGAMAGWTRADHSSGSYYLLNVFKFRSAVEVYESEKLYASDVNISGLAADALDEAVRILIVGEDGMQLYDVGLSQWSYYNSSGQKIGKDDFIGLYDKIVYQDADSDDQSIQIFVYYEGDDTRLFTANLNTMAGVNVAITFAVDAEAF